MASQLCNKKSRMQKSLVWQKLHHFEDMSILVPVFKGISFVKIAVAAENNHTRFSCRYLCEY
jgi:hypothetical protein